MIFLFPMCGESSRFSSKGYTIPKYKLPLWGSTVFYHVVNSFKDFFSKDNFFIFAIKKDDNVISTIHFIRENIPKELLNNYSVVTVDKYYTSIGQAGTVYGCLNSLKYDFDCDYIPLCVFNIDTIRKNLFLPDSFGNFVEIFEDDPNGSDTHWSFVDVDPKDGITITRVKEKERISNLCSTGLYIFKSIQEFMNVYSGEEYISPLYNKLSSKVIKCLKEDVVCAGTPYEYESLI